MPFKNNNLLVNCRTKVASFGIYEYSSHCALRMSKAGLPLFMSRGILWISDFYFGSWTISLQGSMDLALEGRDDSDPVCIGK